MSVFVTVSEDYANRNQSWEFTGLYRNNGGEYRVHVRRNAYEDQSRATIEQWGQGGWNFYTSLPTQEWYDDCPSYARKSLDAADKRAFLDVRDELMRRFAHARWDSLEAVEVR